MGFRAALCFWLYVYMRVELFDFHLPEACIATEPARPREAARLLYVAGAGATPAVDKYIRDLPSLLRPGDVLVRNDTRVIPARLHARKGEASIEILLHKRLDGGRWQAFARPGRKLKAGDTVHFVAHRGVPEASLQAEIVEKLPSGEAVLRFDCAAEAFAALLDDFGAVPLPPYIARPHGVTVQDQADYQTCYAARDGSVAAPTAGLHFTPALLEQLTRQGVLVENVTLHVGAGTFQPVKAEDTSGHAMHSEWAEVSPATAAAINQARRQGGRVIAVGTTSLRVLETAADADGVIQPFCGETDIFITPGYHFRAVDCLLTNFHLPKSTLFMLVCAFSGMERMQAAYAHAIATGYRFYSYGDACFLERI